MKPSERIHEIAQKNAGSDSYYDVTPLDIIEYLDEQEQSSHAAKGEQHGGGRARYAMSAACVCGRTWGWHAAAKPHGIPGECEAFALDASKSPAPDADGGKEHQPGLAGLESRWTADKYALGKAEARVAEPESPAPDATNDETIRHAREAYEWLTGTHPCCGEVTPPGEQVRKAETALSLAFDGHAGPWASDRFCGRCDPEGAPRGGAESTDADGGENAGLWLYLGLEGFRSESSWAGLSDVARRAWIRSAAECRALGARDERERLEAKLKDSAEALGRAEAEIETVRRRLFELTGMSASECQPMAELLDMADLEVQCEYEGKLAAESRAEKAEARLAAYDALARESFHMTFNGGYVDSTALSAFHHGMDTVFNAIAELRMNHPAPEPAAERRPKTGGEG